MRLKSSFSVLSTTVAMYVMAFAMAPRVARADEPPVIGFDTVSYEHAVAMADYEQGSGRWMLVARTKADRELARWELLASESYPDDRDVARARADLADWSDEYIAERYAAWLEDRFFGEESGRLRGLVSEAASRANRAFLYVCDDDGMVSFDDAGDPIMLARGADGTIASDKEAWLEMTESSMREALARFDLDAEASLNAYLPELSAYIGPDLSRYESIAASAATSARDRVVSELDALIAREERLFVARREADSWSLRKRSDGEAADSIVESLIAEVHGACGAALESLRERLDGPSGTTSELDLSGSDWLERFEEQFDAGLELWTEAEERFMVRRLEWERDAATAFADGGAAWSKAYNRLVAERSAWEAKAGELLLSGERAFGGASERLESSIAEARAEFERDAAERGLASSARASAWADVYVQSGQAAMGAKSGAEYWLSSLGAVGLLVGSAELTAWLDGAEAGASASRLASIAKARECIERYDEFMARCSEARGRLIDDFGLAIGSGAGSLVDVLAEGADSLSFCLDEYQVELLRAEAVEGYWRSRVSIAEAVSAYAEDLSSGRATAGDTAAGLAAARSAYDAAASAYDQAKSDLSEAGSRIGEASEGIGFAFDALQESGLRLERAASEYSSLMVELASGGNGEWLRSELLTRYRDLVESAGLSADTSAASEAELLAAYYERAVECGQFKAIEAAGRAMRSAVEGVGEEPSLRTLANAAAAVVEPSSLYDWSSEGVGSGELFAASYGLSTADPAYASLLALHDHTASALTGASSDDRRAELIASSLELAGRLARRADSLAESALEARLDAVALLGAVDSAAWYGSRTGGSLGDLSLEDRLRSDEAGALIAWLEARARLELDAILVLEGSMRPDLASDEAMALCRAFLSLGGSASLVGRHGTLEAIIGLIDLNRSATIESFSSALQSLAADDPYVGEFARGRGFFAVAGSDLSSILTIDESAALERARGMLTAYERYGRESFALERDRFEKATSALTEALFPLGLTLGDGRSLPASRDIAAAVTKGGVDTAGAMADLSSAVEKAAGLAPTWMADELRRWDEAMLDYVVARSVAVGAAPDGSAEAYANKAAERLASARRLGASTRAMSEAGDHGLASLYELAHDSSFSASEASAIRHEALTTIATAIAGMDGDGAALVAARFGYLEQNDMAIVVKDAARIRLEDAWSSWDYAATAEAARLATGPLARIAYTMESMVFAMLERDYGAVSREGLVSLLSPGADGAASWLGSYYASEGQDAGTTMESLIVAAAGEAGDAWSYEAARSRVTAMVVDSLDTLASHIREARGHLGDASAPIERYLAAIVASTAPDFEFVSWILPLVGLAGSYGQSLSLGASEDAAMASAFIGLGDTAMAFSAASFYLAGLAEAGRTSEFDSLASLVSAEKAERGRAVIDRAEACSAYLGDFSGGIIAWALKASGGDVGMALAMVASIEGASSSNSLEGPFGRWLFALTSLKIDASFAEAERLKDLSAYSAAYDRHIAEAEAAEAGGILHWRELLGSNALRAAIEADASRLPEPRAPGEPEAEPTETPAVAASWNAGALADGSDAAHRRTLALNDGLASWKRYSESIGMVGGDQLASLVVSMERYTSDPSTPYDASGLPRASSSVARASQAALDAYLAFDSSRALAAARFGELGSMAGAVGDADAMIELARSLEIEIEAARGGQRVALAAYESAGAKLAEAGAAYDEAYSQASRRYDDLEEANHAYAIEDAIWRWASSAYLYASDEACSGSLYGDPAGELSYCEASLARASTAMAALRGLYDEGQEVREYASSEYRAAYDEYRESYRRLMLVRKAEAALADGLTLELAANEKAAAAYRAARSGLATGRTVDDGFAVYLRIGEDGCIRLAYDASFAFSGAMGQSELSAFFSAQAQGDTGSRMSETAFETNLDRLASWMTSVSFDRTRAERWGLARDYVVKRLAANDSGFASRVSYSESAIDDATIGGHRFTLAGPTLAEILATYREDSLAADQEAAYASLDGDEKAMFDTYLALQLTGAMKPPKATNDGSSTYDAFSSWSDRAQYAALEAEAERQIAVCRTGIEASAATYAGFLAAAAVAGAFLITIFLVPGLLAAAALALATMTAFGLTMSGVGETRAVYSSAMSDLFAQTESGALRMTDGMPSCVALRSKYLSSCDRLASLEGVTLGGAACDESSLRAALAQSGSLTSAEVDELTSLYGAYASETGATNHGSLEALSALATWSRVSRDDSLGGLEAAYAEDDVERVEAGEIYNAVYAAFIAGRASEEDLALAANAAFGPGAASAKTHVSNLETVLREGSLSGESAAGSEGFDAARQYSTLSARAVSLRYDAELSAREAEWTCDRQELYERWLAWRRAGELLLSRGESDFDAAFERLESEAGSWAERFAEAYSIKAAAWDYAYADSLEAKRDWAARATMAVDGAASEAIVAMLGVDAAAAGRKLTSFAVTGFDFEDSSYGAYERVIGGSGLARLGESLEAWSLSAGGLSAKVRAGLAGGRVWESGSILAAAADFALSANESLAGIQAGIMASELGRSIEKAKVSLVDRIAYANRGFDDDMNGLFVADGAWRRDGTRYGKDVVVHSTVGQAFITERVEVPVFAYFELSPWSLGDTLSEASLRGSGASIARARMASAQAAVEEKGREVFGAGDGRGTFGEHVGTSPERLADANPDDGIECFFSDAGSGELGRLMSALVYWSVVEGRGWAEANKPIYDKDLWDDRDDWLEAPTLREVADVGVSVVTGLATGGIGALAMNLADDMLFGALDGLCGYTSWAEASLSFGKKAVGSLANYGTAGLFDGAIASVAGLGTLRSGFDAAVLSGARGFTELASSGLVSSVKLDYEADGSLVGLSIDKDRFVESVFGEGAIAGLVGSMAGAACGSSMDYGGAFEDAVWSGFTDLASIAATESASYATHLAFSSYRGVSGAALFEDAWSHSAGISLNVANARSVLGVAGFLGAVFGDGYDAAARMESERVASSFGSIGLSISIGSGGVAGSLGGGGYDLIDIGTSIGKGLAFDASLGRFAADRGSTLRGALETAYAFGDLAAEETVWRLIAGQDELRFDSLAGKAVTVADGLGNRTITVSPAGDDRGQTAMLELAIGLQHEAWRNGRDDGAIGQAYETLSAVTAHTELAMRLAGSSEFGGAMIGLMGLDSIFGADIAHYSGGSFTSYVAEAYDSIGDNWKLTMDGRLLNDGRARVLAEILNDDGSPGWVEVDGSAFESSTAAALVAYLGEARALELFGGSVYDASRYDDQTLQDVLGLDPVDVKAIRRSPSEAASVIALASDESRRRLLGEALMKGAGIVWDASAQGGNGAWIGEGLGLSLTDGEIHGSAALRSIGSGAYERYSITSEVERGYGAYDVWMDGVKHSLEGGLNRLSYTKWDIDSGEQLATLVAGGVWNTVDNSYGQLNAAGVPIGTDVRYSLLDGPTIQAYTIARGSFVSRWSLLGSRKFEGQDVLILSDATTVAGERLDSAGKRVGYPYDDRWLIHSTDWGSSDGCLVYSKTQANVNYYEVLMAQLKSWGLYQGYAIAGILSDESDFVYGGGYKEGTW